MKKAVIIITIFLFITGFSYYIFQTNNPYQKYFHMTNENSKLSFNKDNDYILLANEATQKSYIIETKNDEYIGSMIVEGFYTSLLYDGEKIILENDKKVFCINDQNNKFECPENSIKDSGYVGLGLYYYLTSLGVNNITKMILRDNYTINNNYYQPISYDNYNLRTKEILYQLDNKARKIIEKSKINKLSTEPSYSILLYSNGINSLLVEVDEKGNVKSSIEAEGNYEKLIESSDSLILKDSNNLYLCFKYDNKFYYKNTCSLEDINYYDKSEITPKISILGAIVDGKNVSDSTFIEQISINTIDSTTSMFNLLTSATKEIQYEGSVYKLINFDNYFVKKNTILY